MGLFDEAAAKARELAKDNPDQVNDAIDRVGQEVDERTGGKFSDQIDQAEDVVRGRLGTDQPSSPDGRQA
jgi:ABC-type transporter Mla subunit MlaD